MRAIYLTNKGIALVDDADYERVSAFQWQRHKDGYAYRCGPGGQGILMHRFILDAPEDRDVDHINNEPADNRRENIRTCTTGQNIARAHFAKRKPETASKYRGVSRNKNVSWQARISRVSLGFFQTEEEAAEAYNAAAAAKWGEFAHLNTIPTRSA